MRRLLRTGSLALGSSLGLHRAVGRSRWRRRRLLILCYHGIALRDEHEWNPGLYLSLQTFCRRMQLIARNRCAVLPLGEAVERLERNDLPNRAVVLTFDDGYYDFLVEGWPLLRDHGYPATVYLPTLRCEHNLPVVNLAVGYMLWRRRGETLNGSAIEGLGDRLYPLRTPADRAVLQRLLGKFDPDEEFSPEVRDARARQLAEALRFDYDELIASRTLSLLAPSEVRQLARSGVDFELHTHRHRTPEDSAAFAEELDQNRRRLESLTGVAPTHFCYPSGIWRPGYLPILRTAGILSATTTAPGLAAPGAEPLLLPRFVDTGAASECEFSAWLQGLAPWLRGCAPPYASGAARSAAVNAHGNS